MDSEISQDLINKNSGKVLKIEKWGLLNFKRKIKNYTKGYFLHFKLEGDQVTLDEIKSKTSSSFEASKVVSRYLST